MERIACKECTSPDCHGCNMYRLERMLMSGKLDALMNENRTIKMDADVRPVVKARWSEYEDELWGETIKSYCCSNCHHLISRTTIIKRFCPNCGAMMEES